MEIIAGPCAFETVEYTKETVKFLTSQGIKWIRGGALKYRSNNKAYQGTDEVTGWIYDLKRVYNFKWVVEVFNNDQVVSYQKIADMYQIGARNMYNTDLLKATNQIKKPVMYKKMPGATLTEWIQHRRYMRNDVIMCLRGERGYQQDDRRFVPDTYNIQVLRDKFQCEICYDVSHPACNRSYVENVTKCAAIYKPNYIMVEVHPDPDNAQSDREQQLTFEEFKELKKQLRNSRVYR